MSFMDKLFNVMKFNEDEDYDEDEEYEDEDFYGDDDKESETAEKKSVRALRTTASAEEELLDEDPVPSTPKPRKRFGTSVSDRNDTKTDFRNDSRSDTGIATRQVKKQYSEAGMEVCIIKPTSVNDAREVTETLLANRTVVLNLEGLDVDIAQRIIDFTSGSCYAVHGNVMKISHYIFVITPANVDVSGDISTATGASRNTDTGTLNMPYGIRS